MSELESIRAKLPSVLAEIAAIDNAGPSRAEIRAGFGEYARSMAAVGRSRISQSLEIGGLHGLFLVRPSYDGSIDLGPSFAAMLGEEEFERRLNEHANAIPEGKPPAERAKRKAELEAERDRMERAEEALIVASEREGRPIDRRADARPEIVLALLNSPTQEGSDGVKEPAAETSRAPRAPRTMHPTRSEYVARSRNK